MIVIERPGHPVARPHLPQKGGCFSKLENLVKRIKLWISRQAADCNPECFCCRSAALNGRSSTKLFDTSPLRHFQDTRAGAPAPHLQKCHTRKSGTFL